jgi:tRNA threonylcarbamoyladenosine biosynthesis protein TsaE
VILQDELETNRLGASIASVLRAGDVILLSGPLGVGKSTLTRAMLRALGHQGDVPSPTFAIVQPYEHLLPPVWHVDLFRIEATGEMEELGLEEAADAVLVVEWPERAGKGTWPDALRLCLDMAPDGARRLTAKVPASWEGRWPPR